MTTTYVEVNPQLSTVAVGDTIQIAPIVQARANTATVTTQTLPPDAYQGISITAHKGFVLYSITSSAPAWVRLYADEASRTADQNRARFAPPTANSGLIAEANFVSAGTINFTPGIYGYTIGASPSTTVYAAVTNTDTSNASIGVSLQLLQLEQD